MGRYCGLYCESGGLPLAIVVVARRMMGVKEIWTWRDTLRGLQKPCEGENPEIEENVYKVLKFSYDRLRNNRCRQCFLYCSLFPEDHEIFRNCLIDLWICEGLIGEEDSRRAELDKGKVILDELIHASLLEIVPDTGNKLIMMHDVIRDMARMIVKVGLQFEGVHILTMFKSFPSSSPHCSQLKTLLFEGYDDIQGLSRYFFANMQSLNVLEMTGIWYVKSLPDSITSLGNLKLLIISHWFELECIPSLARLEKLRHLNISNNERLKEIPKGIERLVNLKVLDLSWNESLDESIPSGVVEKLSHLQTLNLRGSRVEVEAEALISLETLHVHFYNLQKLNCYIKSGHWQRLLEYQIHYGRQLVADWEQEMYLKIMTINGHTDDEESNGEFMILPYNMQYLQLLYLDSQMFLRNPRFVNLRYINIVSCNGRYLFTVDLAQHLLHNVQELVIYACAELEEIIGREEQWESPSNYINHPTIRLPNLRRLELSCLSQLRSIYKGRMVCLSLEFINIVRCDKIERLPFFMEKEGNAQNPNIKLEGKITSWWWHSLQWDDPITKSMYQLPKLPW